MRNSVYSFLDLAGAITHPSFPGGPFIFTGEGVGSVSVSMQSERTAHDVAADGSIMISKMAGNNGQIQVECQQSSLVHKYLLSLYNFVTQASSAEWAMAAIVLRNVVDSSSHIASGVSFGKIPDKVYQREGQKVTWILWAGDVVSLNA